MIIQRPVVTCAIAWIAGIYLSFSMERQWILIVMMIMGIAVMMSAFFMRNLLSFCLLCLIVLLASIGYAKWTENRNISQLTEQFSVPKVEGSTIKFHGIITTEVVIDGDKASFVFVADQYYWSNELTGVVERYGAGDKLQTNVKLLTPSELLQARKWRVGDELTLSGVVRQPASAGNFGAFDYRKYLHKRHIHWTLAVKGLESIHVSTDFRPDIYQLLRWNDMLRHRLGDVIDRLFPDKQSGFMKSLLIGITDDMDPLQYRQFSQLGLTHILAISGLHVAVFLMAILGIMKLLGFTRETMLVNAMIAIPLYVGLSGASPSVIRSGIMAVIGLYAARKHLLKDGLHVISIAALAMLLWNPYYLFETSFQLSFLVTLGLIAGVPAVSRLIRIRSRKINMSISVAVVAQAISFPLTIYYFNQISALSLIANYVFVPFFSFIILPLGYIAMVVGMLYLPAGQVIAIIAAQMNGIGLGAIEWMNKPSMFRFIWATPSLLWIVSYYAFMVILVCGFSNRLYCSISVICLALLLGYGYYPDLWRHDGSVQFINVGQGDAAFIRTPEHQNVLVDGGGTLVFSKAGEEWKMRKDPYEVGLKLLVPLLKQRGVHHLDYIIISHEDTDHIGGLQAVLEQIPVRRILYNGTIKPSATAEKLLRTALNLHIPVTSIQFGQQLQIDRNTNLTFLYPFKQKENGFSDLIPINGVQNHVCVVFYMKMFHSGFLFTGDIDSKDEASIIQEYSRNKPLNSADGGFIPTSIDVLKVAHHGSKTSTSQLWLDYWYPKVSVISVGQYNTYGHPNLDVVSRIEAEGSKLYRTDRQGEVQMSVSTLGIKTRYVNNLSNGP